MREIELKVQREINEKRQELRAKEESLRFDYKMLEYAICFTNLELIGIWKVALQLKGLKVNLHEMENSSSSQYTQW